MVDYVAIAVASVVLIGVSVFLYSPRIQTSKTYQATVVPLANIMDVGFIIMAPAIVYLSGYAAPWVMTGICLLAIATGFAISYNIRHYEPLDGTSDPITKVGRLARVSLVLASVTNIAYYTLVLVALVLWPLGLYSDRNLAVGGTVLLVVLLLVGLAGQMDRLNDLGDKTTAFNLAAVLAVVSAFIVYNVQEAVTGRLIFPSIDMSMSVDDYRKIIGLFAVVQGFEAARYIGERFSADTRIKTMRWAQLISSVVFVVFLATVIILFVEVHTDFSQKSIFIVADKMGRFMPWLILLAAIGSQTSAIVNATMSRSDMLVEYKLPRAATFPVLLVPAVAVFLLADIMQAVALASRVFAAYFVLQAVIALWLAARKKSWAAVIGFAGIALAMGTIAVFGLSI